MGGSCCTVLQELVALAEGNDLDLILEGRISEWNGRGLVDICRVCEFVKLVLTK